MGGQTHPEVVGLPPIVFLFTTDQIAAMLNVGEDTVMMTYLYYAGRSSGMKKSHQMDTINIAPEDAKPEWRVTMREFLNWCKRRNIKVNQLTFIR